MGQKKITIQIRINGFTIPFTIDAEEEEIYRRAGHLVDEKLQLLLNKFPEADFAHIALIIATIFAINSEEQSFQQDIEPVNKKLEEFIGNIKSTLQSES